MQIEEAKKENKEYIFADHFDTLEELLADCKLWIADEDELAYCRWFDFKCMEALVNKIEKQQAELEESKKETQQVLDDYQDLGKEYHKLECELEKAEKVIDKIKFINDTNKPHKAQAKTRECIKQYFSNKEK